MTIVVPQPVPAIRYAVHEVAARTPYSVMRIIIYPTLPSNFSPQSKPPERRRSAAVNDLVIQQTPYCSGIYAEYIQNTPRLGG